MLSNGAASITGSTTRAWHVRSRSCVVGYPRCRSGSPNRLPGPCSECGRRVTCSRLRGWPRRWTGPRHCTSSGGTTLTSRPRAPPWGVAFPAAWTFPSLSEVRPVLFAKFRDGTLVNCQPYLMNRRNDDLRMFGWHFVAAVDNDLLAMGRETSQLRL